MEFMNNICKVASQMYRNTAKKADKCMRETKLKMKMNANKADIEEKYKEMGEAIYRIHISKEEDKSKEEIEITCNEIDEISKEIEEANEELLKIKNKKQCTNCHEEIDRNAKYCPECGTNQNQ